MDLTYLSKRNSHERDAHISFEESTHTYTIDGDSSFTSVTTWCHSLFKPFDTDKIIDNMMRSKNWKNNKYYGKTKNEIIEEWNKNRDEAAELGTRLHYDIECYYNNNKVINDSIEYGYFDNFINDNPQLKPYRTEWTIYDKQLKLAGSIDMVYENPDGTLMIYDWKRCKEIKKDNRWDTSTHPFLSHIPDCNFWHYSLQLNTYKAILEKNYDKKITKMCLICLHPNNKNKSYLEYEVDDMDVEMDNLLNHNLHS